MPAATVPQRPNAVFTAAALLVVLGTASPAGAVLLWKRKGAQTQPTATAPATATATATPTTPASTTTTAPPQTRSAAPTRNEEVRPAVTGFRTNFGRKSARAKGRAQTEPAVAGDPIELALVAMRATVGGAPPPSVITSYPHELRLLLPLAEETQRTDLDRAELAQAHLAYGNRLAQLGHAGDAAAAYSTALQLEPDSLAARSNLGALLRQANQFELASMVLEDLVVRDPRNGLGWFNLALTRESLDDPEGANQAYLQALRLEPGLWLPARNPQIVGNQRARDALHLDYLERHGGGNILLDGGR